MSAHRDDRDILEAKTTGPLHEAFQWADPNVCQSIPAYPAIDFFNRVRDLAGGAAVALEIIERCTMDADNNARTLLSVSDQSALLRLTIASLNLLRDEAEDKTSWVCHHGESFAAIEKARRDGAQS